VHHLLTAAPEDRARDLRRLLRSLPRVPQEAPVTDVLSRMQAERRPGQRLRRRHPSPRPLITMPSADVLIIEAALKGTPRGRTRGWVVASTAEPLRSI
jgi:hypothetical protein